MVILLLMSVQVVYEVGPRDRSDQIRRLEHRRAMENMERRRRNSQRIHRSQADSRLVLKCEMSRLFMSGFTLPRTRRLTRTATRRRMRCWTSTSRRARSSSGTIPGSGDPETRSRGSHVMTTLTAVQDDQEGHAPVHPGQELRHHDDHGGGHGHGRGGEGQGGAPPPAQGGRLLELRPAGPPAQVSCGWWRAVT